MQSTGCRKAYVSMNVDVEGCVHPRYIRWENGLIFQIDQILYKCRAASKKVGGGGIRYTVLAKDIQEFYLKELERVSASSVIHYHANIHRALKYAVKIDLIDSNPADKVERPKKDRFIGSFYDADEANALLQASKGTKLEMPILFGLFYGLRRSEVIGLKWDAIDFEHDTITIRHTVTSCDIDGKRVLVAVDTTKTRSQRFLNNGKHLAHLEYSSKLYSTGATLSRLGLVSQ